jgi:hypothetical protein
VHLGCGDGTLTAALCASGNYVVHGLDVGWANVVQARSHIYSLGKYGPVSADRFDGKRLLYLDNLVNLLVTEDLGDVPRGEVMRVLAPRGVSAVSCVLSPVRKARRWLKGNFSRPPYGMAWPQRTVECTYLLVMVA